MALTATKRRTYAFLLFSGDYPDNGSFRAFASKAAAVEHYADTARDLARYGQTIEAAIHLAPSKSEIVEYPDYVLSLGPRGGVRVETT